MFIQWTFSKTDTFSSSIYRLEDKIYEKLLCITVNIDFSSTLKTLTFSKGYLPWFAVTDASCASTIVLLSKYVLDHVRLNEI